MAEPLEKRVRAILEEQKGLTQKQLADEAGVTKGLVNQWLSGERRNMGFPAAARLSRKYGYAVPWLVEGSLPKMASEPLPAPPPVELSLDERALIARYRTADPRWQLSLRLLAALATEDQIEVATDVNVVIARIMGKKPTEVRYATNESVLEAFGRAPHVASKHELRAGSTVQQDSGQYEKSQKKAKHLKRS